MEHINQSEPLAVLRLPLLDVSLVQTLSYYYLVTVEKIDNEIVYKLYTRT